MLKTDKALYLVETQEDYDNLMVELDKLGVVWQDGKRPTTFNRWGTFKEKTVIRVCNNKISYNDIYFYFDFDFGKDYRKNHFEVYRNNKVKLKASEKFVADWYEKNKDDFENNLYKLIVKSYRKYLDDDLGGWLYNSNKPIQTLINMHQFGYVIEKEPLYIVELPNPNHRGVSSFCLGKTEDGRIVVQKRNLNNCESAKLTECEIKKDFEWAWQFAKEVK